MTIRTKLLALTGAVMLTLAIAIVALATGGTRLIAAASGTPGTSATPATGQQGVADFLAKLAANLGISQDQLVAAIKKTDLQQIDAAQAAGQLTQAQANAARDRVNNSPNGLPPFGIGERHGGAGRDFDAERALLDAGANYFGISAAQLRQDLMATGSWQGVAAKYGKDNATGKAGLEAALEGALRQALTAKGIARAQIDQQVNQFKQSFDQFYTQPLKEHGPRGPRTPQAPGTPATPGTGQ